MPECHKCPLDGRPTRECLNCRGPADTNHKGRVHIELDEALACYSQRQPFVRRGEFAPVAEFLRGCMELDGRTRDLIFARLLDPTVPLRVLGRRHRMSLQAVHARFLRAAADWPVLLDLLQIERRPGHRKSKQAGALSPHHLRKSLIINHRQN
jgi:hypothetical protein